MRGALKRVSLSSERAHLALSYGKESKVSNPFLAHMLVPQGLVTPSSVLPEKEVFSIASESCSSVTERLLLPFEAQSTQESENICSSLSLQLRPGLQRCSCQKKKVLKGADSEENPAEERQQS